LAKGDLTREIFGQGPYNGSHFRDICRTTCCIHKDTKLKRKGREEKRERANVMIHKKIRAYGRSGATGRKTSMHQCLGYQTYEWSRDGRHGRRRPFHPFLPGMERSIYMGSRTAFR
jgi:hypothetical protein